MMSIDNANDLRPGTEGQPSTRALDPRHLVATTVVSAGVFVVFSG